VGIIINLYLSKSYFPISCKQTNVESKEQQTPVCLKQGNAAQMDFLRNATQGPTALDGGELRTPPAQSSALRAPPGSQQENREGNKREP